jgi:hypothetical protein
MLYPQPPQVELLDPTAPTNEQLEVIPRSAVEPPAVAPHAHAPQSSAPSSGSDLFGPSVAMAQFGLVLAQLELVQTEIWLIC